ncbi:MAG: undecaprenyl-phosphate glucose phosphotransferase [Hyphomicrobiaceae bacterium]
MAFGRSMTVEASNERAPATAGDVMAAQQRWSRNVTLDLVAGADVGAILLAGYLSALWLGAGLAGYAGYELATFELLLLTAAVSYLVLRWLGAYEPPAMSELPVHPIRHGLGLFVAFSIVKSVLSTLGVVIAFPESWFPVWLTAAFLLLTVSRVAARALLRGYARRGLFDTSIAVYGAGRIAMKLLEHVRSHPDGTRLVGIYDDRQDPQRVNMTDLPMAGRLADLIEAGRNGLIDEIIIALPQAADRRISEISRKLEQLPVRIRVCTYVASDLIDADPTRHKASSLGPLGLLDVKSKPMADWSPIVKSVEDFVVAALLFVLLLPLMALIAAAIRLDSPGPALFRQRRHGLNHRVIEVLKFRTMHVLEDGSEVRQATRADPRVTRVGRWLRRTSLDELPQLMNILKGEMSLVGPRPHALVHNEHYGDLLERYANRHQVKPGITGWAQINGFRGELQAPDDMQRRVEHDLHYIDHWSIWLDLRILLLTPFYGLKHRNAY